MWTPPPTTAPPPEHRAVVAVPKQQVDVQTPTPSRSRTRFSNANAVTLSVNISYRYKRPSWCVSNCRNIEVPIIKPSSLSSSSSQHVHPGFEHTSITSLQFSSTRDWNLHPNENLELVSDPAVTMDPGQLSPAESSKLQMDTYFPVSSGSSLVTLLPPSESRGITSFECQEEKEAEEKEEGEERGFRFLDLPIELRLKIYKYLLPPRHHKIVTQIPHNGYFYNTSTVPLHASQSFYPFGRNPPKQLLTTYKVLTCNRHTDFPEPSLYPQVLLVNKQIREEAEPVLYGEKGVVFDFGVYTDALEPFWRDRSEGARRGVRNLKVAREVPALENRDGGVSGARGVDARWVEFGRFLREELGGVRVLDLTIWSSGGSVGSFPMAAGEEGEELDEGEIERRWREWDWTGDLLRLEGLEKARVTWWGFRSREMYGEVKKGFDSWLAGRMAADDVMRLRMIGDGVVEEGVVVIPGAGAGSVWA